MKKILLLILITTSVSSCFIFRKKEKVGCPTSGAAIGAERIAAGDEKAIRASNKAKYKGGRKSY